MIALARTKFAEWRTSNQVVLHYTFHDNGIVAFYFLDMVEPPYREGESVVTYLNEGDVDPLLWNTLIEGALAQATTEKGKKLIRACRRAILWHMWNKGTHVDRWSKQAEYLAREMYLKQRLSRSRLNAESRSASGIQIVRSNLNCSI